MKRPTVFIREVLWLLPYLVAGLTLRMLSLDREAAWGDEALTAACLPAGSFGDYLQCAFEQDPTIRLAPLYHLVQYAWSVCFGGQLYSLRMLSVLLSVVAMIQIYGLARRLASPAVARAAVLLFGLSLFQIYYAQEVRVYALLNVLALAAMEGFLAYGRRGNRRALAACLAFNAMLLLTHSFTVLLVVAQGVALLGFGFDRRKIAGWYGVHAVLAMAFVAWVALIGYDFGNESLAYGDMPAGLRELGVTALQFAGARFSNGNPGAWLAGGWNAEWGILVLVAGTVCGFLWRVLRDANAGDGEPVRRAEVLTLVIWLVVPVLLLFVIGRLWRPCFFTRYVAYAAIPLSILVPLGLGSIRPDVLRRAVFALLIGLLLWQNLALPRPFRADYRALVRGVEADPATEKVVLALKPFNHRAAAYALRENGVTVELLYGLKETIGIARARAAAGKSVWVVFYRWDNLDGFEDALLREGITFRQFQTAGMPPLALYHVGDRAEGSP